MASRFLDTTKSFSEYDLVVNSIGRRADLRFLDPISNKLKISPSNKIIGGYDSMIEKTSISNIFAAGDVLENSPRNEPGAAISGKRVA